uniref:Formamidopyrimidine-DNA glycosylase catalytic domain-containing protein n=1 Tax=Rhodotorula toruloides TaxID=5286 RepID=A0A0K3CG24_RHOTO
MPELPEVEAARKKLEGIAKGKRIKRVQAKEDTIVFAGTTHDEFIKALEGKTVESVKRLGKNFYLSLSSPPHPILHFGMSGQAHIRGEVPIAYRSSSSSAVEASQEWPPKYAKAWIEFEGEGGEVAEWAFCDARRLGRIKLVDAEADEIEKVPPLSELGADPLLNMPSLDTLRTALGKRKAPIKAVLLDQNGPFCGLGNYLVDEILYQSAIVRPFPSPPLPLFRLTHSSLTAPLPPLDLPLPPLPSALLSTLHTQIQAVVNTAVAVDADAEKFPKDWLFKFRWGKGKRKKEGDEFALPDGSTSTISFVTVGGRTSAVVDKVQVLPEEFLAAAGGAKKGSVKGKGRKKRKKEGESEDEDAENLDDDEGEVISPHFGKSEAVKAEEAENDGEAEPAGKRRSGRKRSANTGG